MEIELEDFVYKGKSGDLYMDVEVKFNENDVYSGFKIYIVEFIPYKGNIITPLVHLLENDEKLKLDVLNEYNRLWPNVD